MPALGDAFPTKRRFDMREISRWKIFPTRFFAQVKRAKKSEIASASRSQRGACDGGEKSESKKKKKKKKKKNEAKVVARGNLRVIADRLRPHLRATLNNNSTPGCLAQLGGYLLSELRALRANGLGFCGNLGSIPA